LWDLIGALNCPLTLLRGGTSPVVDDADVAELKRRQGRADVLVIDGAGHSIQGDKPRELAAFLATKSV
jgi:pimeloyl-ACP methyl ester carboxylesterase